MTVATENERLKAQSGEQEPVAKVIKATGSLKDIHIIKWLNDYSPNEGDLLFTHPTTERPYNPLNDYAIISMTLAGQSSADEVRIQVCEEMQQKINTLIQQNAASFISFTKQVAELERWRDVYKKNWERDYGELTMLKAQAGEPEPTCPYCKEPNKLGCCYDLNCAGCVKRMGNPTTAHSVAEIEQAITDPENQPSQYGTVTLEYHLAEIAKWEQRFERVIERSVPDLEADARELEHRLRRQSEIHASEKDGLRQQIKMLMEPIVRAKMLEPSPPIFIQQVPEGYKLVPIEPTDEMIAAGMAWIIHKAETVVGYKAMINAAPKGE